MVAAIVVVSSIIVGPLGNIFPSTGVGTVALLVQLTDPPNVPVGTQWLNLTYINLELYVVKGGTSTGWVATGSSGTVNLQSLINVSKTIGIIQIPNGSSVDQIRFDIASVQINVNGTVYSVDTPNSALTVPITGGNKLESLSSTLLQLSPTVTETVTGTGTALPTFLLVPSATAVIREGSQVSQDQAKVGAETQLTSNDRAELEGAKGNVSIASTSLSVSGNKTSFSITIKNRGNVSVALEAVSLHGGFNVSSTSTSCQTSQSTSTTMGSEDSSTDSNSCTSSEVEYPNELVFLANASSTSLVPVSSDAIQSSNALVLQEGQSVTLSFSGTIIITQGDTGNLQTITLFPILGNPYSVNAEFTNNAEAVVQVNATAA